jgi:hypothetical protein
VLPFLLALPLIVDKVLSLCRLASVRHGDCLYGAARTYGDGAGLEGARRAATLCGRAPRAHQSTCFSGVGIIVGLLYATEARRRAACSMLTARHVDACARAANAEVDPSGGRSWG